MNITINSNTYEAKEGERLLDVGRKNHEHIGFFCGGNAICQTCYVRVLEGADLLSPLSDTEKAMLSDNLIKEGTRMACMTTVEKPGKITVVSAVEEVRQMFETNPLQLVDYAGKMGREALVKFPDTMRLQATRNFDLLQLVGDVIQGIGSAITMIIRAFQLPVAPLTACECGDTSHGRLASLHDGCCNGKPPHVPDGDKKTATSATAPIAA